MPADSLPITTAYEADLYSAFFKAVFAVLRNDLMDTRGRVIVAVNAH